MMASERETDCECLPTKHSRRPMIGEKPAGLRPAFCFVDLRSHGTSHALTVFSKNSLASAELTLSTKKLKVGGLGLNTNLKGVVQAFQTTPFKSVSRSYQISFRPSCRLRGVPALVIRPKLFVPNAFPAWPNLGVFVKWNASNRNCILSRS